MILVTGGAGFIGSHMCRRLRDEGIDHVVFDNLERGWKESLGDSRLIQGDMRSREDIAAVINREEITAVIHFAAYIEVGESVKAPAAFWENNTIGVWNLLEEMRGREVNQLVFSSTAAVYGEPQQVPIPEHHPRNSTSPYGDSKLASERMIEAASDAYGLNAVRLRYFNAAGSHPDASIGEAHDPETHLIPIALLAAAGKRPRMKIFGTDYDTPDGTCIRDYIHVCDLVEAHVLALKHLASGGSSDVFNVGTGKGFSVKEVVSAAEKVTGKSLDPELADRRPGDPAVLTADSSKIQSSWGWRPQSPDLETMIEDAWRWLSTPHYGPNR